MSTPSTWFRSGAPLWTLLLVLVVLPLSTLGAFALVLTHRAAEEARASASAADQVVAFGALARASAAVDQELLAVVVQGALSDPTILGLLDMPAAFQASVQQVLAGAVTQLRSATDASLSRAEALPVATDIARRAEAAVAEVRSDVDAGRVGDVTQVEDRWTTVSELVRSGQNALVVSAATAASSRDTVSAIRDVRLLADLTAALGPDLVDYLTWIYTGPGTAGGPALQWAWFESHTTVAVARAGIGSIADPALLAEATALAGTAEAVLVAQTMDAAVGGTTTVPSLAQLRALVLAGNTVTEQTVAALGDAVDLAQASARRDGEAATAERNTTVLITVLALLATALVVWFVGRLVTRSLRRLSGQAEEVSGGRLVEVAVGGPREVRSVGRALEHAVANLRRIQDQAGAVARGDLGDPVLEEAVPGRLGELVHDSVTQLVTSIRQRDQLQTALSHEAAHDPLTDLPNRAQALRLTSGALHRAQRAGTATGLLFVDLDGFKGVNDRAGHAAGDAVLRAVGTRMRAEARAGDTVCRLGGDEFVVLVEGVADIGELVQLGERLVAAVSQPLTVATTGGPRQVAVGASIGVALAQDGEVDGEELLAQADAAVYRAKHAGRGRVEVFDDRLRAHIDERRDVEEALRRGLADGEVHVVYQPVLQVATGTLVGFEALARWDRPGVGLLAAESFVPVAELSDLICTLDRWMLRDAVTRLGLWRAAAGLGEHVTGPTVSVNVSARFLGDPRVTDIVLECLTDAGLPARCLVLEVTERAVLESPLLLTRLADLRALGVAIALDDFGTGTTSIGQLRNLPVDTLKVDGRFLSVDPVDQRLVALMVATAHASGLTVVAEGVEDAAVLDRLAADSCDAAQGFHLSLPLSADDAEEVFLAGAGERVAG